MRCKGLAGGARFGLHLYFTSDADVTISPFRSQVFPDAILVVDEYIRRRAVTRIRTSSPCSRYLSPSQIPFRQKPSTHTSQTRHAATRYRLRLHRARSVVLTPQELVEIRAAQRTFEGAYIRTSLSQFSFALIVLKIFTSEFYSIGECARIDSWVDVTC